MSSRAVSATLLSVTLLISSFAVVVADVASTRVRSGGMRPNEALVLLQGDSRRVRSVLGPGQKTGQTLEQLLTSASGRRSRKKLRVQGGAGRLHFLFLVNGSIPLMKYWAKFLEAAPEKTWRAWVHSATDTELQLPNGFRQVSTVPSEYCVDLVTPMAHLAKEATSGSKVRGNDKFVFVSESTLPVKPFSLIYEELTATNSSDVGITSPTAVSGVYNETNIYLMKHSQWMVLNRRHAHLLGLNWRGFTRTPPYWSSPYDTRLGTEIVETSWVPATSFSCPSSAMLGDKTPLTLSALQQGTLADRLQRCGLCTDEFAILPQFLGTFVPNPTGITEFPGVGIFNYSDAHVSNSRQGRWRTFVTFAGEQYADPPIEDPLTWAVKPNIHPWTFHRIGNLTAAAFRRSHYLFARKFTPDVEIPGYESILLAHEL